MARIRTIKPEFFSHEEIFDAEIESGLPLRVAFIALWTLCDREGRFKWEPRRLKIGCLPYDELDFSRVLDALTTRGFIVRYTVKGVEYGCIPSLTEHQVFNPRESASKLPGPKDADNSSPEKPRKQPKTERFDASTTREARVDHASTTREPHVYDPARGEGKGREGNIEEDSEAKASGGKPPELGPLDLQKELWSRGVSFLKANGVDEKHARPLIGKWRKSAGRGGDYAVLQALASAEAEAVSEPIAFIEAILREKTNGRSNGTGQHGAVNEVAAVFFENYHNARAKREAARQ